MRVLHIAPEPGTYQEVQQARLSGREFQILRLVAEGLESREIAGSLFLSTRTVDFHLASIYRKLDVNNRIRALSAARRVGILQSEL
ncbi:MAG: helix-turn-helix transcriptional regulator [Methanoregulaceae archaeon]|nr:helix-turn-helix transcriptional regulator [Methanoregulaceae archaeon]